MHDESILTGPNIKLGDVYRTELLVGQDAAAEDSIF